MLPTVQQRSCLRASGCSARSLGRLSGKLVPAAAQVPAPLPPKPAAKTPVERKQAKQEEAAARTKEEAVATAFAAKAKYVVACTEKGGGVPAWLHAIVLSHTPTRIDRAPGSGDGVERMSLPRALVQLANGWGKENGLSAAGHA
jgi:hypothetical protein